MPVNVERFLINRILLLEKNGILRESTVSTENPVYPPGEPNASRRDNTTTGEQ
jgi:hypothetical protein